MTGYVLPEGAAAEPAVNITIAARINLLFI